MGVKPPNKIYRFQARHYAPMSEAVRLLRRPARSARRARGVLGDLVQSPLGVPTAARLLWLIGTSDLDSVMGLRKLLKLCEFAYETEHLEGNIVETGSYRCGSVSLLGMYLNRIHSDKRVFACDTFEGQPVDDKFGNFEKGTFGDIDLDQIREKFARLKVDRVELCQGPFTDTLDTVSGPFSMAHIDCDVYESVKFCLDNLYPRMAPGGLMVIDDFQFQGCREAVHEFLDDKPETVEQPGNITWVIRKKQ